MSPFFNKYRYLGYLVQISGSSVFKKKKTSFKSKQNLQNLAFGQSWFQRAKALRMPKSSYPAPVESNNTFFCDAKQESIFCDHIDMNMNWIWIKFPRTYMGGLDWSSLFVHKLLSSINKKIWWMDDGCIIITSYLLSPQHSSTPLAKELNV